MSEREKERQICGKERQKMERRHHRGDLVDWIYLAVYGFVEQYIIIHDFILFFIFMYIYVLMKPHTHHFLCLLAAFSRMEGEQVDDS